MRPSRRSRKSKLSAFCRCSSWGRKRRGWERGSAGMPFSLGGHRDVVLFKCREVIVGVKEEGEKNQKRDSSQQQPKKRTS